MASESNGKISALMMGGKREGGMDGKTMRSFMALGQNKTQSLFIKAQCYSVSIGQRTVNVAEEPVLHYYTATGQTQCTLQ